MAVLARQYLPNHNKHIVTFFNNSCMNSNFFSMQDFTENVNCPDEPMLTCDNYNIDNTLNDKLKFLTEDLVTNMNNVSIKTIHSQTPLSGSSKSIYQVQSSQRRFSEHYLTEPNSMRILPTSTMQHDTFDNLSDINGSIRKHFDLICKHLIRNVDFIKVVSWRNPENQPRYVLYISYCLHYLFYFHRKVVNLENQYRHRYLVVVTTKDSENVDESAILGIDIDSQCLQCTIGLILPVYSDTSITLDGDGGFSVSSNHRVHIFKPVSIQAMWSALQSLMSVAENARAHRQHSGHFSSHAWTSHYVTMMNESCQDYINDWNAMVGIESHREHISDQANTEKEKVENDIRGTLKTLLMSADLDEMTSKMLRSALEQRMDMKLKDYCTFIDSEMIKILRQMDSASMIFDYLYLGSEWNASNLKELKDNGIDHILNVSCEIDNFYPGEIDYKNIRVYDNESEQLINYWQDTFKYIDDARRKGCKVLVHCKMGISRSASTVIAYAMKANDWTLKYAMDHVKESRSCIKPNSGFLQQLRTYQGILDASKQRNSHLWRSFSMGNLENISNRCLSDETDGRASGSGSILPSGSAPASIRSKATSKRALCCPEGDLRFQITLDVNSDIKFSDLSNKYISSTFNDIDKKTILTKLLPPRPGQLINSSSTGTLLLAMQCDQNDSSPENISRRPKESCDIQNEITFS